MGAITLDGILRAEHDVLHDSMDWIGMNDANAPADVSYISGVFDMAHKLVEMLTPEENNGNGNG